MFYYALKIRILALTAISVGIFPANFVLAKPASNDTPEISIQNRIQSTFTGDLDELRKRRIIRVLVSHTKTNFFITKKGFRGIEFDLLKAYEKQLNRGPLKQRYQTHLSFIPVPFAELLTKLEQGYGDIAASGITATPEREALVDFTEPYITNVDEVLVAHKNAPHVQSIEELSGKQIILVANSSYIIHVAKANQLLGAKGLEPIEIVTANPLLEAEDLLEFVNKGLYNYTVIDNHIAFIWKNVLRNIRIRPDIIFFKDAKISWAIQKNLPQLKASLNRFIQNHARPGKLLGNTVYKKYFEDSYWIKEPLTYDLLNKVPCLKHYLKFYGEFYDIDWTLIAAQAYQESRFDHSKISPVGARGIMQIKLSTARDKNVGIKNLDLLEDNIHAGVRYFAFLKERYFTDKKFTEEEKNNFALAAYNAGPGRVIRLRSEAKREGFNPYKWSYNVESIARKRIGLETVNYVTSIQKMRLFLQASNNLQERKRALLKKHNEEATKGVIP